jgi:hypothetical protein
LIPAQHRILWVNCVDLVWNAILATQAQRKESVFEEIEGEEEEALSRLSVVGEPLLALDATMSTLSASDGNENTAFITFFNDTSAPVVIHDLEDLHLSNHSDAFNTTSSSSTEAVAA